MAEDTNSVLSTSTPTLVEKLNQRPSRLPRQGANRRRDFGDGKGNDNNDSFVEKTIFINRSSKVVKGGRRFSFSALIVAGDKRGNVGLGLGKGGEVSDAIRKGSDSAKSQMVNIAMRYQTIPHEILCHFGGAKVLLKPASPGTGLICGKTVRAVVECAGIKDILSKSLGSNNAANVAKATMMGLTQLRRSADVMHARQIAKKSDLPQ